MRLAPPQHRDYFAQMLQEMFGAFGHATRGGQSLWAYDHGTSDGQRLQSGFRNCFNICGPYRLENYLCHISQQELLKLLEEKTELNTVAPPGSLCLCCISPSWPEVMDAWTPRPNLAVQVCESTLYNKSLTNLQTYFFILYIFWKHIRILFCTLF